MEPVIFLAALMSLLAAILIVIIYKNRAKLYAHEEDEAAYSEALHSEDSHREAPRNETPHSTVKQEPALPPVEEAPPQKTFSDEPDYPRGFGYKCQWLAVKTEDTRAVAQMLGFSQLQPANWETGIEGAYENHWFVSPPVEGWTLVVCSMMPDITEQRRHNPLQAIRQFSIRFGEAYYFGTHRVVEYHAWAKAVEGEIVRAYGYIGERGETLLDEGRLTAEEEALHFLFTDMTADEPRLPREEHVMQIAMAWTVDPQMEQTEPLQPGVGFVGSYV